MADSSQTTHQVVMFYDGACPLCRKEVDMYRRLDTAGRIHLYDISQDETLLTAHGVTFEQAMKRLHAVNRQGEMVSGARAFTALWAELPYWHWLAKLATVPGMIPLMDFVYKYWAIIRLKYLTKGGNSRCTDTSCKID